MKRILILGLVFTCVCIIGGEAQQTGAGKAKKEGLSAGSKKPGSRDMPDEATVKDMLKQRADLYIKATKEDMKGDLRYPNLTITILSIDVVKSGSIVTPCSGKIKYQFEFDDKKNPDIRQTHSYSVSCNFFDGKWDLNLHAHKYGEHVEDLAPKRLQILFPNI